MNTNVPKDGGFGFTISFTSDDLDSVRCNGKTGKVNMRHVRAMLGPKVMRIILSAHHNVLPEKLEEALKTTEVIRVSLHSSTKKNVGPLLEVLYRFTNPRTRGSYRHVFHFVPTGEGLSGKLYTQMKHYIAK